MVSLRFPFSFPQPSANSSITPRSIFLTTAVVSVSAAGAAIAISKSQENQILGNVSGFLLHNRSLPAWGSLSLTGEDMVAEKKTGVSFPAVVEGCRSLLGVGVRRKSVLGLKNIDVYAFGVYADNGDINEFLGEKYGKLSATETKKEELINDLMESDISMTVRLQIVYGKLSISSVRSAFEDSVGSRLHKYGGSDNKELLKSFTSQFKDEYKIPRGSIINLSREKGNVLRTTIDGKEVGSIQSKLLCRSVLDLYIGDDPFDRKAKEEVELNLASLIQK